MKRANNLLTKSLQRLSSGKRIVSPSDDAGGLAVGMKLQSSLKRAAASRLNTQNGVSFLQMQDGVLKVAGEILDRMSELKSFYNDVSKSEADRETYNHEFNELQRELNMLKGQKFNGVSLFATLEPDNNPLKINTSDDGLGEKIELTRTGLFENLKSKFGADSVLNTGSHGEYRQLIGDFIRDGGLEDSSPGYTSRAYSKGSVIYKNGPTSAESGYFMALSDIGMGARIEDTGSATSLFIRLADKGGKGFAEAFPHSSQYDHTSMKYNSKGEQVAYLKGDVVKVQAHFASPGSYFYLKAQNDVPRGINLEALFAGGHIGKDGYFNYVGSDRSNGATSDGKPITEFLRTNSNLPMPSVYSATVNTSTTLADTLVSMMQFHAANGYNPGHVLNNGAIYAPAGDWGAEVWTSLASFKEGDLVLDKTNKEVKEFTFLAKGNYHGGAHGAGDFVFYDGSWLTAESSASIGSIPRNPENLRAYQAADAYEAGNAIKTSINGIVLNAVSNMRGTYDKSKAYAAGNVVKSGSDWYALANEHHGSWNGNLSTSTVAANETVEYNGKLFSFVTGGDPTEVPGSDPTHWVSLSSGASSALASSFGTASVTGAVLAEGASETPAGTYFVKSPWQKYDTTGATIGTPTKSNGGMIDRTSEYTDINNTSKWTKTHYTHLQGSTIGTSYTRGDNIFYQGKHYIYTSHLDSDDALYVSPSDDGYTEFGDLLRLGAIQEVPMYIDTVGGGGAPGTPDDIYFRPNKDLKFVDRLPGTGDVRTSNMARRTDAPLPPGDEIYNSPDDAFFGGLEAGNDGIYGTMDDFYASTGDPAVAQASAHLDADADNNKDLLDTTNGLENFSVADFVDYIQTLANVRAVNGGTMSRLTYAERILEENEINLGAATSRIMDADMAYESTKMARQNVLVQAAASMVTQANALNNVVLSLLQ
jgi:flagellin-like hook-associated protein FlgL